MDLDGSGTLVETAKLPLVMKCAIESYSFDKFRQMCILSGCDYLSSLPGIGLAKARQFVVATQDPNFANVSFFLVIFSLIRPILVFCQFSIAGLHKLFKQKKKQSVKLCQ